MRPIQILPIAGLALLAACDVHHNGPVQYESKTIPAEGIDSARVELHMGAGDLRITDGSPNLLRADFSYDMPSWKPVVDYNVSGKQGNLKINQPSTGTVHVGNAHYTWDLQLSNRVPIDLSVDFGAGQAKMEVGSLHLRGLRVHMGVGELNLDLRGPVKESFDVSVDGGVGQATVRVPGDAGVYAEAHGGIGSINVRGLRQFGDHWESEGYARAEKKIRLTVHGGIGEIKIVAE